MTQTPTLKVLEGAEATSLLNDVAFRTAWERLATECTWSTPFQDPPFVTTWYETYHPQFTPLLVIDRSATGALNGLFALAMDREGRVVVAGARQAEYHTWLAATGFEDQFPLEAFTAIKGKLVAGDLLLQYVPSKTPIGALQGLTARGLSVRATGFSRPLMSVGTVEDSAESFKKKSNKSRLNRLAKIGPVRFDRLRTPDELRPFMEQIGMVYDLRQGSLGATPPFINDPRKASFHVDLLKWPDVLHASVLRAGDTFVAGHLGVMGRGEVHVGVLSHSPFFAAHSPGKLLMMFLAQQLASEGIGTLDLTPGGDGWKERFADRHDTVHRVVVSGRPGATMREEVIESGMSLASRGLRAVGLSPATIRTKIGAARRKSVTGLVKSAARQALATVYHYAELHAYSMALAPPSGEVPSPSPLVLRRDAIDDIIRFEPSEGTLDRQAFFKVVLARLEEGHHVYTRVAGGKLVHWGWLAEGQEKADARRGSSGVRLPAEIRGAVRLLHAPGRPGPGSVPAVNQADVERRPDEWARARVHFRLGGQQAVAAGDRIVRV